MGGFAWRMALVRSSLTISSVVSVASPSPQAASWRAAWARAHPTTAGSAGRSQETIRSAGSARVRATSSAALGQQRSDQGVADGFQR